MKALDAYKGTLKELDKHESPTFSIGDFNYFFNKTVEKYITENYKDLDPVQKDIDDIRSVLVFDKDLVFETNATKAILPEKYRHILYLELTCKFKVDAGKYKKDAIHTFTEVRREKSSQRGTKNAYRKTSYIRPYYKMDELYIYTIIDSDVLTLQSAKMDYIKVHTDVYLSPTKDADYSSADNNTTIAFPNYVVTEMINLCKIMFLENTENPRFQSSIVENQVKSE